MQVVSVSDLKALLSEKLRLVRSGEELVVTERGRPIARLVPISPESTTGRLSALAADGVVRLGNGTFPASILNDPGPADPNGLVRAALLSEREEGW
jgi:prevent-host-death family protein